MFRNNCNNGFLFLLLILLLFGLNDDHHGHSDSYTLEKEVV